MVRGIGCGQWSGSLPPTAWVSPSRCHSLALSSLADSSSEPPFTTLLSASTSPGTISGTDSESSSVSSDGQEWCVLRPESLLTRWWEPSVWTHCSSQFCYHHCGSEYCGSLRLSGPSWCCSWSVKTPHIGPACAVAD